MHETTPPQSADAQHVTPAESTTLPVDAPVTTMASLIFVTTGEIACSTLGEFPTQISLTASVAYRIADVLRCALQYPDLESRRAVIAEWNESESIAIPHGRVEMDEQAVRISIEPIGAGVTVAVMWEYVPALTYQLDYVARTILAR